MSLIKRLDNTQRNTECSCKHRGTPDDYPNRITPDDWTPDEDAVISGGSGCCGDDKCCDNNPDNSIANITFGQLMFILESCIKENKEIKEKITHLEKRLHNIEILKNA